MIVNYILITKLITIIRFRTNGRKAGIYIRDNMSDENKVSYRKIRNDVHCRLNNKEAAVFLALVFCSDYKTGESHVTHKTLGEKTGFPESSLKRYLKRLAKEEFIYPHSYFSGKTPQGAPRRLTDYDIQMPDTCYIMADRKLLEDKIGDLTQKEQSLVRGFLLMLKCVCLNFTDTTLYSYRELEKHMNLSYATIAGLMKQCQEYKLVSPNKKGEGYTIKEGLFYNGYPPMEIPKDARHADWNKGIYEVIYEFCKSRRVICPPYDESFLGRISTFGNTPEMLKALYEKRIKHLPDSISSLNYFVRVIDGKAFVPEPEKPKTLLYLD